MSDKSNKTNDDQRLEKLAVILRSAIKDTIMEDWDDGFNRGIEFALRELDQIKSNP